MVVNDLRIKIPESLTSAKTELFETDRQTEKGEERLVDNERGRGAKLV